MALHLFVWLPRDTQRLPLEFCPVGPPVLLCVRRGGRSSLWSQSGLQKRLWSMNGRAFLYFLIDSDCKNRFFCLFLLQVVTETNARAQEEAAWMLQVLRETGGRGSLGAAGEPSRRV
eukprot:SAG11_NODE_7647_length_1116_cov_0.901672_1_plen_116_part_10